MSTKIKEENFFTYPVVHFLMVLQYGGEKFSHKSVFVGGMSVCVTGLEKDTDVICDGNCTQILQGYIGLIIIA